MNFLDLNILTHHKQQFIEMVRIFRKDIEILDINEEINKYKYELQNTISDNSYLLQDFKYETTMTIIPILQMIFIHNNIQKSIASNIIQDMQYVLNNTEQLILLLMEFSIFLKILQKPLYIACTTIEECINTFLKIRSNTDGSIHDIFINFNTQNMVLYNIFFLFSKKICTTKLVLTTEFLVLPINKKIKNILQIATDNHHKRINLHLFQCTQCSKIFDNEILTCCPCGQVFCSKICQILAWRAWHKQICPIIHKNKQCLTCKKYFEKKDIFKCTRCMSAQYCGKVCQKQDWIHHKIYCKSIFEVK